MRACECGGDAGGFEARVDQSVLRCRFVDQRRVGRQRLVERHDRRLGVDPGRDLFGEIFRLGGNKRVQANVDLYNMFNLSSVVNYNSTYGTFGSATAGSVFRQPTQVLDGRLVKFSVQFDF